MKKSRFSAEQIIGFIKQAEAGMPIKELCRKGGSSDATFYKWRATFGGLSARVNTGQRQFVVVAEMIKSYQSWRCPRGSACRSTWLRRA